MVEIELKLKIDGREVPLNRLIELLRLELDQAVERATKHGSNEARPAKPPEWQADTGPRAYSVAEAAALLSVSKATVNRRIRDGKIRAVRVGSRVLVPSGSIQKLLQDS